MSKLQTAGTLTMVMAILNAVAILGWMAFYGLMIFVLIEGRSRAQEEAIINMVAYAVPTLINMLACLMNFITFSSLKNGKRYGLCMTTSIINMLNCGCCLLGTGLGIFQLVVLLDNNVKQYFQTGNWPDPANSGGGGSSEPPANNAEKKWE